MRTKFDRNQKLFNNPPSSLINFFFLFLLIDFRQQLNRCAVSTTCHPVIIRCWKKEKKKRV